MTQQQGFSAVVCSVVMPPGKMSENKPGMKEKKKEKTKPLEEAERGEKKKRKKKNIRRRRRRMPLTRMLAKSGRVWKNEDCN